MPNDEGRPLFVGGERLQQDVDRSSGGGGKYHPFTFHEATEKLGPQLAAVAHEVKTIPGHLRGERVVFEATLLPNYLAPSYFPAALLGATGLRSVGSRRTTGTYKTLMKESESPTKILLLAGTSKHVARFQAILGQPEGTLTRRVRDNVLEFSEVTMPVADRIVLNKSYRDNSDLTTPTTWEAVLHRNSAESESALRAEQDDVFHKWASWVGSLDGEVVSRYRRIVDGLTFVPIRIAPSMISELVRFNPLRAIRPMPQLRPITPLPLRAVPGPSPRPLPSDMRPRTESRVAIFDAGVDPDCPFVAPFVSYNELTTSPAVEAGLRHGSLVTTTVLYGYLGYRANLDRPNVLIDHYRIFPVPPSEATDLDLNWMLDQIVDNLSTSEYRLVNLSLGPDLCVEDDLEPSRWTAELDALARDKDILFITAAGNNGDNIDGLDRVQAPADMANGMAVGAADSYSSVSRFDRASYSAVGPGRWGARIQPVGLCFGGDGTRNPFIGIGPRGERIATRGTSFAAPLALHGLTDLVAAIGSILPPRSHLFKALAVHFAHRRKSGHDVKRLGFGLLRDDYSSALHCAENEATVIYQAKLQRDQVSGFYFPLPQGLAPDHRVEIIWTICFTSPVDPAEALDYTKAGIQATFRPHMQRIPVHNSAGKRLGVFNLMSERGKFEEAISAGGIPADNPASDQGREIRLSEQRLREAGKWETIVHHRFTRRAKALYQPRLDISYFLRDEGGLLSAADCEDLEISLIVSLRGPRGSRFYEMVRQEFDVLVPIDIEIEV